LLQDADLIEGSTLAGNTTVFRDAVVYELERIHPGSLRYMDTSQWCSDVADEIAATGNRRWCNGNEYLPNISGPPVGYNDVLALANLIGSDAWISVGVLNQASDWTTLINWLSSSGWTSTFAASGHKIYLEDGNEAWNSAAFASLFEGNGIAYGYTLGLNMAAAKAASGYNRNVIQLVSDSWDAPEQGYSPYGWLGLSMQAAGCTLGTQTTCPNLVDIAPYTLGYLGNFDTSGSNVSTTGAPFLDEWAEITNWDSVTSPPASTTSIYLDQQYANSNYGLDTAVYEVNLGAAYGINLTQLQMDQIAVGVASGLITAQHLLLMQRDAQVTGPMHVFTLAEPYNPYNGTFTPTVMPLWGTTVMMATGPGQTAGAANVDRPLAIALEIIDSAIGANSNLMSITQTGTPTFSYAGGQPQDGTNSILPNTAIPYVNCFAYANSAQTNWTTICFNNNLSSTESVTLAGAGAPTGSVTQTIFPNSGNLITDHNENSYVGPSSLSPVVVSPSSTSTSGTTYSIPPASMLVLSYSLGGTQTLATPTFSPGAGTYSGTQTVIIDFPSGSTGCVAINTMPTATTPGTCGSGGTTTYTGPITVSSSETVNAIATEAGSTDSAVGTAAYNITVPTDATPTFSPAAGTYTTAQSVTISDATSGTTIYYTTNGSVPTTSSAEYSGPITVSASETLEAIAVETGYSNSTAATAAYTISSVLPAPTFNPAAGAYSSSQSVTIGDATAGTTIHYTTNGSVPTTSSAVYSGPITVSASETLEAIAVETGYSNSAAATAAYTIGSVLPAPTFSPAAGTYSSSQSVTIGDATAGATIYYTTNGSVPTTSSAVYSGPITVSASETLEAIAVETGYTTSAPANAAYIITVPAVAAPTFSPAAGAYTSPQSVTINDATAGATIYYTTNGSAPTTGSALYSGPITVSASETLEAIAVETGYTASATAMAAYVITITVPTVAAPTFLPVAGIYTTSQSVTIGDATAGATIYYTTDGSVPTTSSTVYSGPITVSSSETLEAIAVETGYANAATAIAAYTINLPQAAAPTFSPPGGTYNSALLVTISDATPGATIYYTTNRTTPTVNSTVYSGPISVSTSETVEAIAAAGGTSAGNSAVAMAGYTLNLPAPGFTIALSSASLDITPGQSGTTTVIVTPENSFASPITFSCSGLPAGAACGFSPVTLTPSSSTAVATMTITTSATTAASRRNPSPFFPASSLAVALCLLGRKRKRGLLVLALVSLGLGMCTGCGGVVHESQPAPQSTVSAVTVTATGGSLQQNATLTLTLN
jgi:LysM repeat protein